MTDQAIQTLFLILEKYGFPTLVAVALFVAIIKGVGAIWTYFKDQIKLAQEERVKFLATLEKHLESIDTQNTLLGTMASAMALLVPVKENTDNIPFIKNQNEAIKNNLDNLQRIIEEIRSARSRRK